MSILGKCAATLATLVAVTACGSAEFESDELAGSTSQQLVSGREWGFAWAQQATGSPTSTTPFDAHFLWSRNSSGDQDGGGLTATITNTSTGLYTVAFPNIMRSFGSNGEQGNVQVTAYGGGSERCKVAGWGGGNVNVACFAASGALVNTLFAVSFFAESSSTSELGYMWAHDGATALNASVNALGTWSFNSTGAVNTFVRTGTGTYRVSFPGVNATNGVAEVTAYGDDSTYCKVVSWGTSGVNVACFASNGAAANSRFALTYSKQMTRGGKASGYGTIVKGGTALFPTWSVTNQRTRITSPFTSSHDGGPQVSVSRTPTGHYSVTFPELIPTLSSVKVTARGTGSANCKVVNWGGNGKVGTTVAVNCFNAAGAAADSDFTISYVTSPAAAWSQLVSDEGSPLTSCDGNSAADGFRCTGSNCDWLSLHCTGLPAGTSMNVGMSGFSDWFSEENADIIETTCALFPDHEECSSHALNQGQCGGNSIITGLKCSGSFCDSVSVRCTRLATGHVDTSACFSTGYQSEEQGGLVFPPGFFATGMDCTGSFCDNSSFLICPVVP